MVGKIRLGIVQTRRMSGDEIKIEKLERNALQLEDKMNGLGIILIIPTMKLNFA